MRFPLVLLLSGLALIPIELPAIGSGRLQHDAGARRVRLALPDRHHNLSDWEASPVSVRGPNFRVRVDQGHGRLIPFNRVIPVKTWRGARKDGQPGTIALHRSNGRWEGAGFREDGSGFGFEEAEDGLLVFEEEDLAPLDVSCGVATEFPEEVPGLTFTPVATAATNEPVYIVELGVEADYEFFLSNASSVSLTVHDIENVMSGVNTIYERDVGVSFRLGDVIVRQSTIGNYTNTDATARLEEFEDYWQANYRPTMTYDLAHLFTGVDLDSTTIGIAYIGAVCGNSNYGLSQSKYSNTFANRFALTAHELGHNFGGTHCTACNIMCAQVGGCTGNFSSFVQESITRILAERNSSGCLENFDPADDDVSTAVGVAVEFDPRSNDVNAEPESLSVLSVSTATTGVVTLVSTSLVRYLPPAHFRGQASFDYTVENRDGFQGTACATVQVGYGLEYAAYTFTDFPILVPDFSMETPAATGVVDEINLDERPANNQFGMTFEGWLEIPQTGSYTFTLGSDEGSLLSIDGVELVNNDGRHFYRERFNTITLTSGYVRVNVEYYELFNAHSLVVEWSGPGFTRRAIDATEWVLDFQDADTDGLPDYVDPDDDNDGNPDDWELSVGLNPYDDADATVDSDLDGPDNSEEYIAGTDPLNSNSVFDVEVDAAPGIEWFGVVGRRYQLQSKTNLLDLGWLNVGSQVTGSNSVIRMPVSGDVVTYRIQVELIP